MSHVQPQRQQQEEVITKTVTVRRHPKRRNLDTAGLTVIENHLYPEGCTDPDGNLLESYVEIGTETSDRLEMVAPKLYVERTIRHKVISREDMARNAEDRTIRIAPLPPAPIEHGMAGASLLADIILGKFLYHLPFYRQINRFREFGLRLPVSTIGDWYEKSVESLNVLYKLLRQQVMSSEYIQVDESVAPVIDNEKHRTRKGYEWCVRDGLKDSLFFWYDRGSRSKKTARELLGGYRGTFQSDGYEAYEQFCGISGVQGAACWAHARRKFVDALKENRKLATQAIVMIGKLYEVERKADEAGMSVDQRRELRQKEAYPVIQLMERWCVDTYTEVLESSLLGKAIAYTYSLMDRLAVYVNDGRINIDNNLIENAIRPLALGRKNWLFCGNDAPAYRAAIVYSLAASCRAADVDPRQWLEHVLVEIPSHRKSGQPMDDLLPLEYAKRPESRPWNLPDPD
ncbi:MAG: IS66 family transposase [Muribaculaceae bacterium]|nr:IS66 family transposase [Muribaculaceae bacterium]